MRNWTLRVRVLYVRYHIMSCWVNRATSEATDDHSIESQKKISHDAGVPLLQLGGHESRDNTT